MKTENAAEINSGEGLPISIKALCESVQSCFVNALRIMQRKDLGINHLYRDREINPGERIALANGLLVPEEGNRLFRQLKAHLRPYIESELFIEHSLFAQEVAFFLAQGARQGIKETDTLIGYALVEAHLHNFHVTSRGGIGAGEDTASRRNGYEKKVANYLASRFGGIVIGKRKNQNYYLTLLRGANPVIVHAEPQPIQVY